ncbi:MAG: hypothetical protein J6K55_00150 [Clostridia bacterium]|nr:hypothetical protein [Clostridia bacterium]
MFMDYRRSKQLRPKTMGSYEQTLKLFSRWLKEKYDIENAEEVKETEDNYGINLSCISRFLLCNKPSRSRRSPLHTRSVIGSNPIAATTKNTLKNQGVLLFYPESGMEEYATHTLEIVFFCTKTAQNVLLKSLQMLMS